jgi:hypothetical protein
MLLRKTLATMPQNRRSHADPYPMHSLFSVVEGRAVMIPSRTKGFDLPVRRPLIAAVNVGEVTSDPGWHFKIAR